ncbi:MAG: hypothetical protein O3A00_28105 [Planctomycetota bacterium]|nr:hypothetical protein [Planctomycetota bacterium]
MRRFMLLAGLALTIHDARAGERSLSPDDLLPEECLLFVEVDGLKQHREAYSQTTFAGLLDDALSPLADDLMRRWFDAIGPGRLTERMLAGAPPQSLIALDGQVAGNHERRFFAAGTCLYRLRRTTLWFVIRAESGGFDDSGGL